MRGSLVTECLPLLGGRYEVGELIGRGGMAEVHIGHDTRLGRTVAIKMLRADLARDPTSRPGSAARRSSAASLSHPAIVAVYDTGEETTFAGRPRAGAVHRHGVRRGLDAARPCWHPARPSSCPSGRCEIVDGVLAALAYSHQQGIVHRDIKPANVMLTAAGDVKVMDFGIARAVADMSATMTQTRRSSGRRSTSRPSRRRGEQVDARSPTSTRPAACFTSCSPAGRRSSATHRSRSPTSTCGEEPVPPSQRRPRRPGEPRRRSCSRRWTKDRATTATRRATEMRRNDIAAALAGRPLARRRPRAGPAVPPPPWPAAGTLAPTRTSCPSGRAGRRPPVGSDRGGLRAPRPRRAASS